MRHSIAVKFISLFLAALSLFAALGSALGIVCLSEADLYDNSVDDLYDEQMSSTRREFAVNLAHRYASLQLGHCPEAYLNQYYGHEWMYNTFQYGYYFYTIRNEAGEVVETTATGDLSQAAQYSIVVTDIRYRSIIQGPGSQEIPDVLPDDAPDSTEPPATSEESANLESEDAPPEVHWDSYYDIQSGTTVKFAFCYADLPPYTVELYLLPGALPEEQMWTMLKLLWQFRTELVYILCASLLVFAIVVVWLCCTAGRKPGSDEIHPGGLNRIPLDIYALIVGLAGLLLAGLGTNSLRYFIESSPIAAVVFASLAGFAGCLLAVGFFFACAAQFKVPVGYWWRHSLAGHLLQKLRRLILLAYRGCRAVVRMLPLIWQWLLTAFAMACSVGLSLILLVSVRAPLYRFFFLTLLCLCILVCIAIICYGAYAMGLLIRGARHMARGELYYQIPTHRLVGVFRDCAQHLNALAGAAQLAAERQLRSERMKTELITNVSHDIKTPLTSIINYVDLMKLPHSPEENQQYLEVLDRQSQRLKKLVDDLMEMSKASTGNLSVDISRINAGEAVNQALGEFADKLERAELIPVFQAPESPIFMLADGRHVWRVLSNLLSNAVKYALPGTRLYIDLLELEGRVVISMKNISREPLNVRADELLERFVRGDASRNTEGSGLGLNIAKSLMELQKGQLQLLVDGDLFKVTLIFPA